LNPASVKLHVRNEVSYRRLDMARKERIVKYTDKELRAMQEHGESKSNWAQAAAMTDEEIDAAIAIILLPCLSV